MFCTDKMTTITMIIAVCLLIAGMIVGLLMSAKKMDSKYSWLFWTLLGLATVSGVTSRICDIMTIPPKI